VLSVIAAQIVVLRAQIGGLQAQVDALQALIDAALANEAAATPGCTHPDLVNIGTLREPRYRCSNPVCGAIVEQVPA
jgi:hypothetical protein